MPIEGGWRPSYKLESVPGCEGLVRTTEAQRTLRMHRETTEVEALPPEWPGSLQACQLLQRGSGLHRRDEHDETAWARHTLKFCVEFRQLRTPRSTCPLRHASSRNGHIPLRRRLLSDARSPFVQPNTHAQRLHKQLSARRSPKTTLSRPVCFPHRDEGPIAQWGKRLLAPKAKGPRTVHMSLVAGNSSVTTALSLCPLCVLCVSSVPLWFLQIANWSIGSPTSPPPAPSPAAG